MKFITFKNSNQRTLAIRPETISGIFVEGANTMVVEFINHNRDMQVLYVDFETEKDLQDWWTLHVFS